jgi:hypothetical protein
VNWSQTITLSSGPNYIEVYAFDNSEARNTTTIPITINFQPIDSLAPNIVVTSHQNGQTVNTKTITVSGTATDAARGDNGISSVYLNGTIPGATATGTGTATWSQTVTLYPKGNEITIYAYDNSDVQNRQTLTLLINFQPVDALPPTLVITSHTNGQVVATSTIQLRERPPMPAAAIVGSRRFTSRQPAQCECGAGEHGRLEQERGPLSGPNYIDVNAYDNSDVQNQASQTITIVFQPGDSLPPNLTVTSHTNGATVFTAITLSGTAAMPGAATTEFPLFPFKVRCPIATRQAMDGHLEQRHRPLSWTQLHRGLCLRQQ